jgi:hypothetical protein
VCYVHAAAPHDAGRQVRDLTRAPQNGKAIHAEGRKMSRARYIAHPSNGAAMRLLIVALAFCAMGSSRADTATDIVQSASEPYTGIQNYRATVSTFRVSSMHVSDSEMDGLTPTVVFYLYYRSPDRHAVQAVTEDPEGIFRVEPLSTLARMQHLHLRMLAGDTLSTGPAYAIEGTSPARQGEKATIWVDMKTRRLVQAAFELNGVPIVTTQFRYPPGDDPALLPHETRSYFPQASRFYMNRIARYDVNTDIPDDAFSDR